MTSKALAISGARSRGLGPVLAAGLAGAYFLAAVFWPALGSFRHGFPTYYVTARLIWEGRWTPQVYDEAWFIQEVQARTPNGVGEVFAPNPPSAALLMLPLAWLDMNAARQTWLWINLALLVVTLSVLARLPPAGSPWARAGVAALPLLAAPVHENIRLANVYLALLCMFALCLRQLENGRPGAAGAGLGLAAGLKLSGSPLWLVLAARGHWRALGAATAAALVVAGLSLAITGLPTWQRYAGVLVEHAKAPGWAAGLSFQATPSFFQHMFQADALWNPRPAMPQPAWVGGLLTSAVAAGALSVTAWQARRGTLRLGFAAALSLGVVVLPFAEEYHYALLMLPMAVAASHLAQGPRPWPRGALAMLAAAAMLLAAPWPYKDPWLNTGWHALLGYPRLYGGWLLWAWLIRALGQAASAPRSAAQMGRAG